jgi:pentapeptide repeat protein
VPGWVTAARVLIAGICLLSIAVAIALSPGPAPLVTYGFAVLGLVTLIAWVVWKVPQWQAGRWPRQLGAKDRIELEDKARGTIVSLIAGVGLVAAAALTLSQITDARTTANRTAELTRQGQLDDRFIRAVDDIGASDASGKPLTVPRLAGIYLLEQFAYSQPNPDARAKTVTAVLTAYIRENAPAAPEPKRSAVRAVVPCANSLSVRSDVEAALTVLRRLHPVSEEKPSSLDLSKSDLTGANLSNLNLGHARLIGTRLFGATLRRSALKGARLERIDGRYACFDGSDLSDAYLISADLRNAEIRGTTLSSACFVGTDFGSGSTAATLSSLKGGIRTESPCDGPDELPNGLFPPEAP